MWERLGSVLLPTPPGPGRLLCPNQTWKLQDGPGEVERERSERFDGWYLEPKLRSGTFLSVNLPINNGLDKLRLKIDVDHTFWRTCVPTAPIHRHIPALTTHSSAMSQCTVNLMRRSLGPFVSAPPLPRCTELGKQQQQRSKQLATTRGAFVRSPARPAVKRHRRAARCQCCPGLPASSQGPRRPAVGRPPAEEVGEWEPLGGIGP
ncbi:unnamed protein product [Merluccius merluccius]